jgi:tetratricopeptide (TPR) repeat protein
LQEAERRFPKTPTALIALRQLSDAYLNVWNTPAKAVECQRKIAAMFAGTPEEFEARTQIGRILYESKNYPEAIFELTQMLAKIPKGYRTEASRTMLGLAYLATSNYADARDEFAQVINTDSGEFREKSLYLMGYSYISEQKYPEALKPFQDLVNLYPDGEYAAKARSFMDKIKPAGQTAK